MKGLIISADQFEDSELLVPYYRLLEEGIPVHIAAPARGTITGKHGYGVTADLAIGEVAADDYSILILPGGKAPSTVRRDPAVLEICRSFFAHAKPVAAICHGPQPLVDAGLLSGRRATCYHSVAEELRGAGARYEDSEVVVDGNLITSREPADLPAFMREIMKKLKG